ncbi:MAG: class I SAM-dependent methyltransferase [Candidatus Njordarchaeota archaeon]
MTEKIFDELAEMYDSWYNRKKDIFLKEVECFRKIIDADKPWLEVGVGSGRFAKALGIEYGLDPAKNMVELARKRGIKVFLGYGEKMPFSDEFFGAVFLIVTICFVKDPEAVLKEAWRVLKPHGKIYLGLIPRDFPLGQEYIKKGQRGHKFYSAARFFSMEEIKNLLEKTGFRITKICYAGLEKKDFVCIEAQKKISSIKS